ncbi:hypothetical protein [Pantoea stewartii]|uniref:hypothetical protein n=1 Tax=Pantoea stewartii TaxID=66269 RepID=UPI0007372BBC|nr:hypothetical protein [Pantoea stewartii]
MSTKPNKVNGHQENVEEKILSDIRVGYVMPIAKTDGYPDTHWNDVMSILDSTVLGLGISKGRIVSDGGEITTIHSRIVNNLNDDDIIICDVSSRNPNVMFELGMRIAFDKPVIIIKDDATDYCFDSGTIEHIAYPKDLRHGVINKFQAKLADKIKFTYEKYIKQIQPGTSPILKNFGSFDKRDVQLDELSANEKLLQDIQIIKNTLVRLQMSSTSGFNTANDSTNYKKTLIARWSGNNAQINTIHFSSDQLRDAIDWAVSRGLGYVLEDDKSELNINVESRALYEELIKYLEIVRSRK